MWIQQNVFPPIWIDSAFVRFMVWREPTSMASVFSLFSLSLLLSIQAFTDNNKTRNLTLNIEIPWAGMPCAVAYHLQISGD